MSDNARQLTSAKPQTTSEHADQRINMRAATHCFRYECAGGKWSSKPKDGHSYRIPAPGTPATAKTPLPITKLCVWWSVADEGLGQQPVVVSAQPAGLPAAITEIHVTYPASLPDPAR